ncbi:hypothetical protein F4780DRAFT_778280 [Xylariomycetidae sp. FL0641]|nr:hypothetical protein F4780DRAFT_778280 [Xylariomycetidae sp. FL0641]
MFGLADLTADGAAPTEYARDGEWFVENAADDVVRAGADLHTDNPSAEELNYHGILFPPLPPLPPTPTPSKARTTATPRQLRGVDPVPAAEPPPLRTKKKKTATGTPWTTSTAS